MILNTPPTCTAFLGSLVYVAFLRGMHQEHYFTLVSFVVSDSLAVRRKTAEIAVSLAKISSQSSKDNCSRVAVLIH